MNRRLGDAKQYAFFMLMFEIITNTHCENL